MPAKPRAIVVLESLESVPELVIVETCLNVMQHLFVGIIVEMVAFYVIPDIMRQQLGLVELQDLLIRVMLRYRNDIVVISCHCC